MTDQHRATPKQWEFVEICSKEGRIPWLTAVCILELRSRIEALEAAQLEQAESNRFCTDGITLAKLAHRIQSGTLTSAERAELGVVTRVQLEAAMLRSASDARQAAMPELRAASAEARPAASEIFPVEYADSNGDGIRIIMEPADETGRVCWVVRNSRRVNPIHEFPTPEAAYAAHQARAEDEADRG
jgi:hypothetical protein